MAIRQNAEGAKGPSFQRSTQSHKAGSGSRRSQAKLTVGPSGASRGNTEFKEMAAAFIKAQGQDPNNYQFAGGGNEELGQMALYAPKPGDTGLMKVTLYRNAVSFHAGGTFKDFPKLRPATKVDCFVEPGADSDGEPCLIVSIGSGVQTRTVKRGSGSTADGEGQ